MKKLIFITKVLLFLFVLQSCSDFDPRDEPYIGICEWDENNQVGFTDLQLQHPSDISNFHSFQIPFDGIERSLLNILEVNGDTGTPSQSSVSVNLKSDGTTCSGEKSVAFKQGASEVSIATIDVPFVSNATFFGEVTVGIRTDTYINTVGSGSYYHIMWSETGNDPNGGIVGNILGTKITYSNKDGSVKKKIISKDGCYYENGQQVCL